MQRPIVMFALLLILTLLLTSCGAGGGIPTLIPTLEGMPLGNESPRLGGSGSSGVPPTWTPPPTRQPPTPIPPPPTDAPDESYTIQPGDTLAEIAARFGVNLDTLKRANDIVNIDRIEVGQVLTIPR